MANMANVASPLARRLVSFLDLPRELRDPVYEDNLLDNLVVDLYRPNMYDDDTTPEESFTDTLWLPRRISSIVLTSKVVMDEALEVFFANHTFALTPCFVTNWTPEEWVEAIPRWRERFGDRLRHIWNVGITDIYNSTGDDFFTSFVDIWWEWG